MSSTFRWEEVRWSLRARSRMRRLRRLVTRRLQEEAEGTAGEIRGARGARVALAVLVALYASVFAYLTVRNHFGIGTTGFDIGIFDQGTWLLSRFKEPFVTVRGLHLFGDHPSFILLPLVPAYWIWPSTAVLLIAQATALASGAIAVFLLARDRIRSEWAALLLALAYLVNPVVQRTNFDQFHPDAFEIPLLLFALYFMFKRRWGLFLIFVGALLLVKEDVALVTFALGIYVAIRYDRRVGLITSGVSLLWFVTLQAWVIPHFSQGADIEYAGRVTSQFGGFGGFFKTLFLKPWDMLQIALGPERPWYLWQLLAPVALVCLLAPELLLIAAGPLLSNLISTFPYQHMIQYHYSTLIVPVFVAAAVVGIGRVRHRRWRMTLIGAMVAASLVTGFMWGPLGRNRPLIADPSEPNVAAFREAVKLIPADASVAAYYAYVPQIAHREHIYEFPNPFEATNWGDFSIEGQRLPESDQVDYILYSTSMGEEEKAIAEQLMQTEFVQIYEREGTILLKRSGE
ncbi:MAG: hypothetical protein QOH26_1598 [Actinomycetota bacterium]|nr:hypothetical protein [Actinomycetota bacterium]